MAGLGCCLLGEPGAALWCALLEDGSRPDDASAAGAPAADESSSGQLAEDGRPRCVLVSAHTGDAAGADALDVGPGPLTAAALEAAAPPPCANASLLPTLAVVRRGGATFLVHPHRITLRRALRALSGAFRSHDLATLCGGAGGAVDLQCRFLAYQLLRGLAELHDGGLALDRLDSNTVFVTDRLWLEMLPRFWAPPPQREADADGPSSAPAPDGGAAGARAADVAWVHREPGADVPLVTKWVRGDVSNFEYLLALNAAVGRTWHDVTHHAVMPWVSDLTSEHGGWRDLTKTKYRLAKGDAMLDRTYALARHHVPEPALSELALTIYLSRRMPTAVLKRVVRASVVAEHYPATIARLYEWTPDECIPEFYSDASVFESLHERDHGLRDLGVPAWCADAVDFVKYHRSLLESDYVSADLHHWIDLVFGVALAGPAAMRAKNVPLVFRPNALFERLPKTPGSARLFCEPHPQRHFGGGARRPGGAVAAARAPGDETRRRALEAFVALEPASSRSSSAPAPAARAADRGRRAAFDGLADLDGFARDADALVSPRCDTDAPPEGAEDGCPRRATLADAQRADEHAAACLIAELYAGAPPAREAPAAGVDGARLRIRQTGLALAPPPPAVRALVNELSRGAVTARGALPLAGPRDELYEDVCAFPTYFVPTYDLITRLAVAAAAKTFHARLGRALRCLRDSDFADLDLAGVLLALPTLLTFLQDADRADGEEDDDDADDDDDDAEYDDERRCIVPGSLSRHVAAIVDAVGARLGVSLTAASLVPKFAKLLERHADALLGRDADALWRALLRRGGPRAFISLALPAVVDAVRDRPAAGDGARAFGRAHALAALARDDALGPALAARYVLPALVASLVSAPAGGDDTHAGEAPSPSPRAAAFVAVARQLGGLEVAAPAVLEALLDKRGALASLEGALSTRRNVPALLDVVAVLRALLVGLDAPAVLYYYVKLPPVPLARLLGALLPSSLAADAGGNDTAHHALTEVASLVSLVCMHVGVDDTVRHLLPDIDKFFAQLVHLYRTAQSDADDPRAPAAAVAAQSGGDRSGAASRQRRLALDVARELYTPLAAMLTLDVMRRHAPSAHSLVDGMVQLAQQAQGLPRGTDAAPPPGAELRGAGGQDDAAVAETHRRAMEWSQGALEKGIDWVVQRFRDDREEARDGAPPPPGAAPDGAPTARRASAAAALKPAPPRPPWQAPYVQQQQNRTQAQRNDGMELHELRDARSAGGGGAAAARRRRAARVAAPRWEPYDFKTVVDAVAATRSSTADDRQPDLFPDRLPNSRPHADIDSYRDSSDDDAGGAAAATSPAAQPWRQGLRRQPPRRQTSDAVDEGDSDGDDGLTPRAGAARGDVWLVGDGARGRFCDAAPWDAVGRPWAPRLRVAGALRGGGGGARALAVDEAESVALCGGRDGGVRVWSLQRQPPEVVATWASQTGRPIKALHALEGDLRRAVSTDGASVDVWDVDRGAELRRWVWAGRVVDVAPLDFGYGAGGALRGGATQHVVVALAADRVAIVDARAAGAAVEWAVDFGPVAGAAPAAPQGTQREAPGAPRPGGAASAQHADAASAPAAGADGAGRPRLPRGARCVAACGDLVVCGSEGGRCVVFERRVGRAVAAWQPHGGAVVEMLARGRHEVLTVGADGCAVLWDLGAGAPRVIAALRGLPDARGAGAAVRLLDADCGALTLVAASGHKVAAHHVAALKPGQPPLRATVVQRHFVDDGGRKLRRHALDVEALAVLPLRKCLLLGCDDGFVRVAV
ncbi:hypothetical protein M885DRAFT_622786 [Pelagophyceae sp. CCMP2097]|nr:hypothetical protein M885DRAFT_625978 [Pelagophyceae sp. CCMP2097]KAJ1449163.1 hypothetical protein M885DRAFT_622786 [Pelagophyceae sp. CCMP2097]